MLVAEQAEHLETFKHQLQVAILRIVRNRLRDEMLKTLEIWFTDFGDALLEIDSAKGIVEFGIFVLAELYKWGRALLHPVGLHGE